MWTIYIGTNKYEPRAHYIDDIPIGRYNVAPGTRVFMFNQRDDKIFLDPVNWAISPLGQKNQSYHR